MVAPSTLEHPFARLAGVYQPSLLALDEPDFDRSFTGAVREDLGRGAWVELVPGWVSGSDQLFDSARDSAPWGARKRVMWGKLLDEPRLAVPRWADPPEPVPEMARALGERYGTDLSSVSTNLYRDGDDSVAWHGDNSGKLVATTVVAIVSLGSPRRLHIRPRGGGTSRSHPLAQGDLLVMGGTCQRTFDHAVPKTANAGPRISVMFREPGVF